MRKLLSCFAPATLAAVSAAVLAASFAAISPAAAQPAPAQPGPAKPAPKAPAKPAAQPAPAPTQPPPAPAPPAPDPPPPSPTGTAGQSGDAAAGAQPAPKDDGPLMPPPQKTAAPDPDPDKDAAALAGQGAARPGDDDPAKAAAKPDDKPAAKPPVGAEIGARPGDVYAEDWWSHARPTFELHGFFRVRSELMDHFSLGRKDQPGRELWAQPADNDYVDPQGPRSLVLCGDDPENPTACQNNTQAGANMRFRINPELHISDNLRIMSQIDLLDNVVLGSTPEGYANEPAAEGGYNVVARGGYAPLGAFSTTVWAPQSGVNSNTDSIVVKRVWAEYTTPVGVLRFGRMPSHWGLGLLANGGDGHDSDWQSTTDRLMFVTGIKKYDIYFAAAWDFANEGATSVRFNEQQGQTYDVAQKDDVSQYVFAAVRRRSPELQKLELAKGQFVLNGGAYFVYRYQELENITESVGKSAAMGESNINVKQGYVRRHAEAFIPDLWVQFLYEKFRFEAEAVLLAGSIENLERVPETSNYKNDFDPNNKGWKILQFGFAAETDYRALEDKLKIGLGFGYATGDKDVESLAPQGQGLQPQATTDRNFTMFRFHPDYRVDLILFRNIMTRVQGAYYLRPNVSYDFTRDRNGQRIGGNAALIWSRASEFIQTPGHQPDLGLELNFGLYYQAKDGTLNDDPDKLGGFFTSLQYGVLFPLGGLGYMSGETAADATLGTQTAQMVRWYLGVLF